MSKLLVNKYCCIIFAVTKFQEDQILLSLICEDDIIRKAWLKNKFKNNVYVGLQVYGYFYEKNHSHYFVLEESSQFLCEGIWSDAAKLMQFKKILGYLSIIPFNLSLKGVYFLLIDAMKSIIHSGSNLEKSISKKIEDLLS